MFCKAISIEHYLLKKFFFPHQLLKRITVLSFKTILTGIYEKAGVEVPAVENPTTLYVAVSSDRGLCGALHSSIGRDVRDEIERLPAGTNAKVITIGEKAKAVLQMLVFLRFI